MFNMPQKGEKQQNNMAFLNMHSLTQRIVAQQVFRVAVDDETQTVPCLILSFARWSAY